MYVSQEQLSGQSVAFSAKALMLGHQYASQSKSSGREQGARSRQSCSRHGAEGPKWGGPHAGEGRAPSRQASPSRGLSSSPDSSISVQTCSDISHLKRKQNSSKNLPGPHVPIQLLRHFSAPLTVGRCFLYLGSPLSHLASSPSRPSPDCSCQGHLSLHVTESWFLLPYPCDCSVGSHAADFPSFWSP